MSCIEKRVKSVQMDRRRRRDERTREGAASVELRLLVWGREGERRSGKKEVVPSLYARCEEMYAGRVVYASGSTRGRERGRKGRRGRSWKELKVQLVVSVASFVSSCADVCKQQQSSKICFGKMKV